jgi:predicted acetyltransferase
VTLQAADITLRAPKAEELKEFFDTCEAAFGYQIRDEDAERWARVTEPERMLWAFDGDAKIGTAGALSFSLTVPGGELPAAGVTAVGVLPSHRRRGLLTRMMRHQLDDVRDRGEPLAILWASEGSIYGRYGYGIATQGSAIDIERDRAHFRDPGQPVGRTRLITLDEARTALPPIYERLRLVTPGMVARSDDWWQTGRLADPEHHRQGGGPLFCAVLEIDGRDEAYALYRFMDNWDVVPKSKLRIREVMATSPLAMREIWRFLFGVDLIERVEAMALPPDYPLFLMLTEPRRLRMRLGDGLWLRFVDLSAALRARSYASDGAITFELRDAFCPWNEGTWRLEARGTEVNVDKDGGEPELRLDVADLGSTYLGGFSFGELARAGRIQELNEGASERADALFRTPRAPWCPEVF